MRKASLLTIQGIRPVGRIVKVSVVFGLAALGACVQLPTAAVVCVATDSVVIQNGQIVDYIGGCADLDSLGGAQRVEEVGEWRGND